MSFRKNYLRKHRHTQLCVGPMSKNCIDAAIELSEQFAIPMILIASRRQVDSEEFGGGYVENHTTTTFSQYVKSKKAKNIYLARDHGGPWQSLYEVQKNMDIRFVCSSIPILNLKKIYGAKSLHLA